VRQDLATKDMDLRTAMDNIRDSGRWRHLVKTSSSVNTWWKRKEEDEEEPDINYCLV